MSTTLTTGISDQIYSCTYSDPGSMPLDASMMSTSYIPCNTFKNTYQMVVSVSDMYIQKITTVSLDISVQGAV